MLGTVMRDPHFFQNCGTFNINQNKKYPNIERKEDQATIFLKWTDWTLQRVAKYRNMQSLQF